MRGLGPGPLPRPAALYRSGKVSETGKGGYIGAEKLELYVELGEGYRPRRRRLPYRTGPLALGVAAE